MSNTDIVATTVVASILSMGAPAWAQTEPTPPAAAEQVAPTPVDSPTAQPAAPTSAAPASAPPARAPSPAPIAPTAGVDSFAGSDAGADEPTGKPASIWYGGPMLVVDGLCLGLAGIGAAADSENAAVTGVAVGMTTGFAFHIFEYPAKQKGTGVGKGLLSLALRVGLGIGGCALGDGCFGQHISDPALLRMSGGLAAAALFDDLFLARRSRERPRGELDVAPTVAWNDSTVHLGMAGTW